MRDLGWRRWRGNLSCNCTAILQFASNLEALRHPEPTTPGAVIVPIKCRTSSYFTHPVVVNGILFLLKGGGDVAGLLL